MGVKEAMVYIYDTLRGTDVRTRSVAVGRDGMRPRIHRDGKTSVRVKTNSFPLLLAACLFGISII